jgi:hypothetical protein
LTRFHFFDREHYKKNNSDVKKCVDSGNCVAQKEVYGNFSVLSVVSEGVTDGSWSHFQSYGYLEGRPGVRFFDVMQYAADNPDVAKSMAIFSGNELSSWYKHYIDFGKKEGRKAMFRPFHEGYYLGTYPDVAEAVRKGQFKSGLEHFVTFGVFELRSPSHPSVWTCE